MDFVIVSNYPVGGMENWGLIIFHTHTILSHLASIPFQSFNSAIGEEADGFNFKFIKNFYKISRSNT